MLRSAVSWLCPQPLTGTCNPFVPQVADAVAWLIWQLQLSIETYTLEWPPSWPPLLVFAPLLPVIRRATRVSFLKNIDTVMSPIILAENPFKINHMAHKEAQENLIFLSTLVTDSFPCCSLPSCHTSAFPQDSLLPLTLSPKLNNSIHFSTRSGGLLIKAAGVIILDFL